MAKAVFFRNPLLIIFVIYEIEVILADHGSSPVSITYKVICPQIELSWDEAKKYCYSVNGSLVSLLETDLGSAMDSCIKTSSNSDPLAVSIGLVCLDRHWRWLRNNTQLKNWDNTPGDFMPCPQGEPICAIATSSTQWYKHNCRSQATLRFICEIPVTITRTPINDNLFIEKIPITASENMKKCHPNRSRLVLGSNNEPPCECLPGYTGQLCEHNVEHHLTSIRPNVRHPWQSVISMTHFTPTETHESYASLTENTEENTYMFIIICVVVVQIICCVMASVLIIMRRRRCQQERDVHYDGYHLYDEIAEKNLNPPPPTEVPLMSMYLTVNTALI